MKRLAPLAFLILFYSIGYGAGECRDANGNAVDQSTCADDPASTANESALPDEALAQVNELKVKFRYFKAIGFHTQSKEKRDEIAAIYDEHGVPLPDEYKE